MRRTWFYIAAVGALAVWAATVFANPSNPPTARTGAPATGTVPAENLCTGCHSGNALNTNGSVTVLGVPSAFTGSQTYRLTVRLASTQTSGVTNRAWGFEMTAVDSVTGAGVGTFAVVDATQTSIGTGTGSFSTRRYPRQSSNGSQDSAASPVEWLVDWTAPPTSDKVVKFYFVGLAGNGGGTDGDWVYTGSATTRDITTPTVRTTWGEAKGKYLK